MLSVLMCVYKEPIGWIDEAINSILEQTFQNFEFLIINDNPNDRRLSDYLNEKSASDSRIRIITNPENFGLTKSLNIGLAHVHGKYIARMDADDISMPTRFEKQVAFLEKHPDVGVCGSNIRFFGRRKGEKKYPEHDDDVFIFKESPFAHPVVMIRARVLRDNGLLYNTDFHYAQDYELWSRMHERTHFHNLQEGLLKYRITDKQISTRNLQIQQQLAASIRRKAFNDFCKEKNISYALTDKLALKQLRMYKNMVLPVAAMNGEKKAITVFYYYLYRSVETSSGIQVLLYLLYSGDFRRFSIVENAKIVVYNIFRNQITPML